MGTKSCTAQASVSKVLQAVELDTHNPMRGDALVFKELSKSHDFLPLRASVGTPVESGNNGSSRAKTDDSVLRDGRG